MAWIFSFHIDKVLAWLSFQVSVQISENYWHKFPFNHKLAQSILKRKFPFVNTSPPKRAYEKYNPKGFFSEFLFSVKSTASIILHFWLVLQHTIVIFIDYAKPIFSAWDQCYRQRLETTSIFCPLIFTFMRRMHGCWLLEFLQFSRQTINYALSRGK